MRRCEVELVRWGNATAQLSETQGHLAQLLEAFRPFADETVIKFRAPYGTRLIEDGVFQWDELRQFASLRSEYGRSPVPLGLVLSKSVELFDPAPGQPHRFIPVFLVTAGAFIGLFENFAQVRRQASLAASAGGTTLMVLPQLGDDGEMRRFAKSIGWNCAASLRENLKPTEKSSLAFGEFFAEVLAARNVDWFMEMIIFTPAFLEKIKAQPLAKLAVCELALEQMSVARERAEATMSMLRVNRRNDQGDFVAVGQIARGYRPGFAPVLGSAIDESILPAAKLHEIFYHRDYGLFSNWEEAPAKEQSDRGTFDGSGKSRHYFPAIFRPSLPGEPAYYFLFRPYGELKSQPKNQTERTKSLVEDFAWLEKRQKEGLLVREAFRTALEAMIRDDLARWGDEIAPLAPVYLGNSKVLSAGAVRIEMVKTPSAGTDV
jgi:hypothetical protein